MQIPRPIFKKAEKHLLKLIEEDRQDTSGIPRDLSTAFKYDRRLLPPGTSEYFFEQMAAKLLVVKHPLGGWMRAGAYCPPSEAAARNVADLINVIAPLIQRGQLLFKAKMESVINNNELCLDDIYANSRAEAMKKAVDRCNRDGYMLLSLTEIK